LINQNKFVIETDTHIKFIEYDKSKKIPCKATHVKNLMEKNQYIFKKINLYNFFKNYKWIILTSLKIKHTQYH
jgi:hypothetical protein